MKHDIVRVSDKDVHIPKNVDIGVAFNREAVVLTFNYPDNTQHSVALSSFLAIELTDAILHGVEKLREGEPSDIRTEH